jgi:hypothetical protein
MPELDLDAIRRDLAVVPPPPWRWIGNKVTGPFLVTDHSGQLYLLGPAHPVDEHGGQITDDEDRPVFADLQLRDKRDSDRYAVMRTAAEMIVPRAPYDPDTYRDIDNPVARWIVRSAAHATALVAEVDRLREQIREAVDLIDEYDGPEAPFADHGKWANARAVLTRDGGETRG